MNKFLSPIHDFWSCLVSVGMTHDIDEKERKYIKSTNVVAVLTAIAVFLYIPFSILQRNYGLAALQALDLICILSVLWLNHLGYHKLSRQGYIWVVNSFVFINACVIGYESRVHDFFYITFIVPFLLFSIKDHKSIIIGVSSSIVFFCLYKYTYGYFVSFNADLHSQYVISNINVLMKFALFGVAIYILSYYNHSTEAELEATNQKLQHQAEELKRSNNDLEQFAAIISHDLKAPVRNVSSFMALLKRRYGGSLDADALSFIDLSKDSTDRMARQIDDLLSYSKLGRDLPRAASVDINSMIRMIKMELGEKIKEKNAQVVIERHLPTVRHVHSSMIYHVFQNLISNGVKFNNNSEPEINISCEESIENYTFCIRDNGIGIDPYFNDKLFQMFKRLHTENEFEGTGIGLAVCKRIVEFYGGNIWLDSKIGAGTSFYFSLPRRIERSQIYNAKFGGLTTNHAAALS